MLVSVDTADNDRIHLPHRVSRSSTLSPVVFSPFGVKSFSFTRRKSEFIQLNASAYVKLCTWTRAHKEKVKNAFQLKCDSFLFFTEMTTARTEDIVVGHSFIFGTNSQLDELMNYFRASGDRMKSRRTTKWQNANKNCFQMSTVKNCLQTHAVLIACTYYIGFKRLAQNTLACFDRVAKATRSGWVFFSCVRVDDTWQ